MNFNGDDRQGKDEADLFRFDESKGEALTFAEEKPQEESLSSAYIGDVWKVLVVDDESDVHTVTKLALDGFELQKRNIEFLDAYSAEEAKKIMKDHPDIAIVLLDVVMESSQAGLDLVRYIRDDLGNTFTRIILRTGQPGEAPEKDVVKTYQINDYKTKTELTSDKLYTAVLASLRTYEAMVTIYAYRMNLERKVKERTMELEKSLKELQDAQHEIINLERKNTALAMAVTTSHEINQPLMVIKGSMDLINMSPDVRAFSQQQRNHLSKIEDSVTKISQIMKKFNRMDSIKFSDYTEDTQMVSFDEKEE